MGKGFKWFLCVFFLVFSIIQNFIYIPVVEAEYYIDQNNGVMEIDFLNRLGGIQSYDEDKINVDVVNGSVSLSGTDSGSFTLTKIDVKSLKEWDQIEIQLDAGSYDNIQVDLYSCENTLIDGDLSIVGGRIDLSSYSSYSCIQPKITLNTGYPSPVISKIKVTRNPYSYIGLTLVGSESQKTCETTKYNLIYGASYVDNTDVYIWVQEEENDNPDLYLSPITIGGYTNVGRTTEDTTFETAEGESIVIPAKSVYWYFEEIKAGETSVLSFNVKSECGTANGTSYGLKAYSNGDVSDLNFSSTKNLTLTSSPYLQLYKSVNNTIDFNGSNYLYMGYKDTLVYNITASSTYTSSIGAEGVEKIYIREDLSSMANLISNYCGSGNLSDKITVFGNGSFIDNKIIWQEEYDMGYNFSKKYSYQINFSGCDFLNDEKLTATTTAIVTSYSSAISTKSATTNVINLEDISPEYTAKKYETTYDSSKYYDELLNYILSYENEGLIAIGDLVLYDKIPEGMTLVSNVTLNTDSDAEIFYNNTIAETIPAYDLSGASLGNIGTGWTQQYNSGAKWVLIYQDCLSSEYFPANSGTCLNKPSKVEAKLSLKYATEDVTDVCVEETKINKGYFQYNKIGSDITNNTLIEEIGTIETKDSSISFSKEKPGVNIAFAGSKIIDPSVGEYTYTMELTNNTTEISRDTQVELLLPQVLVNGEYKKLFTQIVPGSNFSIDIQTDKIVFDIGDILGGQSMDLSFKVQIPDGLVNNSTIQFTYVTIANDEQCGEIRRTNSFLSTVNGYPNLIGNISKDLSFISQFGKINYKLTINNIGNVTTNNAYMVAILPEKTTFQSLTTAGTGKLNEIYNCTNCEVYFAGEDKTSVLPTELSSSYPLTQSDITNYFSLGNDNGDGTRSPTVDNVKYIAILADHSEYGFYASSPRSIGLELMSTEEENGKQISMNMGVLSPDLTQSISNTSVTSILDFPGVAVNLSPEKEIIQGCESDIIYLDYYSDVGGVNDIVELTTTIQSGLTINQLTNQWNSVAISEGSEPITEYVLSGDDYEETTNFDGSKTYTVNVVDLLGKSVGNLDEKLSSLEGGRISFYVTNDCNATSNTVYTPITQVAFENEFGEGRGDSTTNIYVQNADLYIVKNVDRYDPIPGDTLVYTLDIANMGQHDAENITIQDVLPLGTCFVTGSATMLNDDRTIGAPALISTTSGECTNVTQETIIWDMAGSNTIYNTTTNTLGYLEGLSDIIQVRYKVSVTSGLVPGTDVVNGASITTTNLEDDNYPNEDETQTQVPYPELEIAVSGDDIVYPGEGYNYTISYKNNSRTCAEDAYIVQLMPDNVPEGGDGIADMIIHSILSDEGVVYYNNTLDIQDYGSGNLPTFNPSNPAENGWLVYNSNTVNQPIQAIALLKGDLCKSEGTQKISVIGAAKDPIQNNNIPIGYSMYYQNMITNSIGEDDMSNNTAIYKIITPGTDLKTTIVGSPEGGYPGNIPGGEQVYSIEYINNGKQSICNVWLEVNIPNTLISGDNLHNFDKIELKDDEGKTVSLVDINDQKLIEDEYYEVEETIIGGEDTTTYSFKLGGDNSSNVCLPAEAYGTFDMHFMVDEDLEDSTAISASSYIDHNSLSLEVYTGNNYASTSTYAYRSNLSITKVGYSSFSGGLQGDISTTAPGDIITYKIDYNNNGNIDAENTMITENLPQGLCLDVANLEENKPTNTTIVYYDDNMDVVTTSGSIDCDIRTFIVYLDILPAPANFQGEDTDDFGGIMTDLVDRGGLQLGGDIGDLGEISLNNVPGITGDARSVDQIIYYDELYMSFGYNNGTNQLWKMNNDEELVLVTDTLGSLKNSYTYSIKMKEFQDDLYIVMANYNNQINELWKMNSNGGLTQVSSGIWLTGNYSYEVAMEIYNNELYIAIANYQNQNNELWKVKTDGTLESITSELGSNLRNTYSVDMEIYQSELYIAIGNNNSNNELFKIKNDGTLELVNIAIGGGETRSIRMKEYLGELYIAAANYTTYYSELWKVETDGGVVNVTTEMGSRNATSVDMEIYNNELYIAISNYGGRTELWKIKSDKELELVDNNLGYTYYTDIDLEIYSGELYILMGAYNNNQSSLRKVKDDNTVVEVQNTLGSNSYSYGVSQIIYQEELYITLPKYGTKNEIWKVNKAQEVEAVSTGIGGYKNTYDISQAVYQGELYILQGNYDGNNELWKVNDDGNLNLITDSLGELNKRTYDVEMRVYAGELYMVVANTNRQNELFKVKSDGSIESMDGYLGTNSNSSYDIDMQQYNGDLYIAIANYSNQYNELWRIQSDGVIEFVSNIGTGNSREIDLEVYNSKLYMAIANYSATWSSELWSLDSADQLQMESSKDIWTGFSTYSINQIVYNDELYISIGVYQRYQKNQLWKVGKDGVLTLISDQVTQYYYNEYNYTQKTRMKEYLGELYIFNLAGNTSYVRPEIWKINSDGKLEFVDYLYESAYYYGYDIDLEVYNDELYIGIARYNTRYNELLKITEDKELIKVSDALGWGYGWSIDMHQYGGELYIAVGNTRNQLNELWRINYNAGTDGRYQTSLSAGTGFLGRSTLFNTSTLPSLGNISLDIYPDATYTTGTELMSSISLASGNVDLSDIDTLYTNLYPQFTFSRDEKADTPILKSFKASYISSLIPSFTFDTYVSSDTQDFLGKSSLTNQAQISTVTPESNYEDNLTNYTHIFNISDIEIKQTVDKATAYPGANLEYTIKYVNNGPSLAKNVTIVNTLPLDLTYVSSTPTMTVSGTKYSYVIGDLDAYASGEIKFQAKINTGVAEGAVIIKSVSINSNSIESNYLNNSAKSSTIIGDFSNIYTTIACPDTASLGGNLQCLLKIGNNGSIIANSGSLELWFDENLDVDNFVISGSTAICEINENKVTCNGGELLEIATGEEYSYIITIPVFENYNLLDTNNNAEKLVEVSSHISTITAETTVGDNDSYSEVLPVAGSLSSIAGTVYLDRDMSYSLSNSDYVLEDIQVCISGENILGENINQCLLSYTDGSYSFGSLYPGLYDIIVATGGTYPNKYSKGGLKNYTITTGGTIGERAGFGSLDNVSVEAYIIKDIDMDAGEQSIGNNFGMETVGCGDTIYITAYAEKTSTKDTYVKITGSIATMSTMARINGLNISTNSVGGFEYMYLLKDGLNTIHVSGIDGECSSAVTLYVTKEVREGTITYTPDSATSGNVLAYFDPHDSNVTLTNNIDANHLFTNNGTFTYTFIDEEGHTGEKIAEVDRIDKIKPTCNINYNSPVLTDQDVTATLTGCSEEIIITNNSGSDIVLFEQDGSFKFTFQDLVGNTGESIAEVKWIDKTKPTCIIDYSIDTITNQNVTATLTGCSEEVVVTNNSGNIGFVFEENGDFKFTFQDLIGNTGEIIADVSWIDKIKPTAEIEYDITTLTNQNVIAEIVNMSETIFMSNNDGNTGYTFTENGLFTLKFVDLAGNTGELTAEVTWIDKIKPMILGVTNGKTYDGEIIFSVTDNIQVSGVTLNGIALTGWINYSIEDFGTYIISAEDTAKNIATTTFTIGEETKSSGGGGGGGGGVTIDYCPDGDDSGNYYDGKCKNEEEKKLEELTIDVGEKTNELEDSYEFAKDNKITTTENMEAFDKEGNLIRMHLAKMISEFAINIMGKTELTGINLSGCYNFLDMTEETEEMKYYTSLSCKLGLMGRESDQKTIQENFAPYADVTRGQLGTILSRLLRGATYATNDREHYYERHLNALQEKRIITVITPNLIELRGWAILMMYRVLEYEKTEE